MMPYRRHADEWACRIDRQMGRLFSPELVFADAATVYADGMIVDVPVQIQVSHSRDGALRPREASEFGQPALTGE
jgi:hypothetical protein